MARFLIVKSWANIVNHASNMKLLQLGTYDAIANFNIGRKSSCLVFEKLGMIPGRYTTKLCQILNKKRLYHSVCKSTEKAKKCRVARWLENSKSQLWTEWRIRKEQFMILGHFEPYPLGFLLVFCSYFSFLMTSFFPKTIFKLCLFRL